MYRKFYTQDKRLIRGCQGLGGVKEGEVSCQGTWELHGMTELLTWWWSHDHTHSWKLNWTKDLKLVRFIVWKWDYTMQHFLPFGFIQCEASTRISLFHSWLCFQEDTTSSRLSSWTQASVRAGRGMSEGRGTCPATPPSSHYDHPSRYPSTFTENLATWPTSFLSLQSFCRASTPTWGRPANRGTPAGKGEAALTTCHWRFSEGFRKAFRDWQLYQGSEWRPGKQVRSPPIVNYQALTWVTLSSLSSGVNGTQRTGLEGQKLFTMMFPTGGW